MPSRRLPLREAELFKSLGHPGRLQFLWILAKEGACVCHLEARFRIRQAYLSQQLAVLREAGLVAERRMMHYIYCPARRPQVGELIDVVRRFAGGVNRGLPDPKLSACSCPRCVVLAQPLAEAARRQSRAPSAARKVDR
jgi:ArsR family transcriptional regulator